MRQALRIGAVAAAAATGILSAPGVGASALTSGQGQSGGSPGVLSGNSVQAPVSVPVNVCGNSVDAVGALNPATGNHCSGTGTDAVAPKAGRSAQASYGYGDDTSTDERPAERPVEHHAEQHAEASVPHSGSGTQSSSTHSGGVLSGNSVQAPVDLGLNLCGDTVDVVGLGNPAMGNACADDGEASAVPTPADHERPPAPHSPPSTRAVPDLPHAGAEQPVRKPGPRAMSMVEQQAPVARGRLAETGAEGSLLAALTGGSALLLGGGILYRRAAARR